MQLTACALAMATAALLAPPAAAGPAKGAKAATKTASTTAPVERTPRPLSTGSVERTLKDALTAAVNDPALDGADFGFLAVRLKDGAVLANSGGEALINPASNAKIVTTAAALDVLKAEYRFKTEYFVNGSLKDGTLYGNLVVKGYGDPTVVTERLQRVANELYLFGIERITGSVIVDDSFFDNNQEAKGWEIEEAPDRAYAAPVSALTLNYNAVGLYMRPGSEPGQPAVIKVDPPVEVVKLQAIGETGKLSSGVRNASAKDAETRGTLLTAEGVLGTREAPFRIYRRVYGPTRYFASGLIAMLQQRGVRVAHRIIEGPVPAGSRLILVDRSERLTEVLADLNHYSNNILAETLIKTMGAEMNGAPGTFDGGLAVARNFLETKVGLAPGSYVFNNGSGLNDVNRITAKQIVKILGYMNKDAEGGPEFVASMAVAGTQGTIGSRMRNTPAQRRLRAKTGTLRGVSALSGYVVDPRGDTVAFAILAQGFKSGASPIWKVQNAIGTALASDGTYGVEVEEVVEEAEAVSSVAAPEPALGGAP